MAVQAGPPLARQAREQAAQAREQAAQATSVPELRAEVARLAEALEKALAAQDG